MATVAPAAIYVPMSSLFPPSPGKEDAGVPRASKKGKQGLDDIASNIDNIIESIEANAIKGLYPDISAT